MWMHNSIFIPLARNVDSYLEMRVHLADSTRWLGIDFDSVSSLVERTLTVRFIREQNSTKRKQNKNEKKQRTKHFEHFRNKYPPSKWEQVERKSRKKVASHAIQSTRTSGEPFYISSNIYCFFGMFNCLWTKNEMANALNTNQIWRVREGEKHKTHILKNASRNGQNVDYDKKDGSTRAHHWITNKFSTSKDNRS